MGFRACVLGHGSQVRVDGGTWGEVRAWEGCACLWAFMYLHHASTDSTLLRKIHNKQGWVAYSVCEYLERSVIHIAKAVSKKVLPERKRLQPLSRVVWSDAGHA